MSRASLSDPIEAWLQQQAREAAATRAGTGGFTAQQLSIMHVLHYCPPGSVLRGSLIELLRQFQRDTPHDALQTLLADLAGAQLLVEGSPYREGYNAGLREAIRFLRLLRRRLRAAAKRKEQPGEAASR